MVFFSSENLFYCCLMRILFPEEKHQKLLEFLQVFVLIYVETSTDVTQMRLLGVCVHLCLIGNWY